MSEYTSSRTVLSVELISQSCQLLLSKCGHSADGIINSLHRKKLRCCLMMKASALHPDTGLPLYLYSNKFKSFTMSNVASHLYENAFSANLFILLHDFLHIGDALITFERLTVHAWFVFSNSVGSFSFLFLDRQLLNHFGKLWDYI